MGKVGDRQGVPCVGALHAARQKHQIRRVSAELLPRQRTGACPCRGAVGRVQGPSDDVAAVVVDLDLVGSCTWADIKVEPDDGLSLCWAIDVQTVARTGLHTSSLWHDNLEHTRIVHPCGLHLRLGLGRTATANDAIDGAGIGGIVDAAVGIPGSSTRPAGGTEGAVGLGCNRPQTRDQQKKKGK